MVNYWSLGNSCGSGTGRFDDLSTIIWHSACDTLSDVPLLSMAGEKMKIIITQQSPYSPLPAYSSECQALQGRRGAR